MLDQNESIMTVVAIADRAKRRHQPGRANLGGERPGGELNSVVGVDDSASRRLPVLDCHIERVHDKGRVLGVVDRPANDLSAEGIHDGAAIDFAFSRGMLHDIRNP